MLKGLINKFLGSRLTGHLVLGRFHTCPVCAFTRVEKSGGYVSVSSDLFGLAYPKAFISKIRCYDNGDRTYPHRDLPAANKHHPFEDEPQGVSDRDDKKNRSRKLRKRILAQWS
jgi:hypothetical protein